MNWDSDWSLEEIHALIKERDQLRAELEAAKFLGIKFISENETLKAALERIAGCDQYTGLKSMEQIIADEALASTKKDDNGQT